MAAAKKRGLGRGLDALLGGEGSASPAVNEQEGELRHLPIQQIQPGKYQPRRHWNEDALDELAASIKAQGLIQPVVVRAIGKDKFELIAGERRWRAAQRAQMSEIPALVKEVSEAAVPAMALIENIQRQDLTPLEEADALKRLIEDFNLTHQQAADAVGRSRASVSNMLRLTELPAPIRKLLDEGKLEMGHAPLPADPGRSHRAAAGAPGQHHGLVGARAGRRRASCADRAQGQGEAQRFA